jgi:hypothetical protein
MRIIFPKEQLDHGTSYICRLKENADPVKVSDKISAMMHKYCNETNLNFNLTCNGSMTFIYTPQTLFMPVILHQQQQDVHTLIIAV